MFPSSTVLRRSLVLWPLLGVAALSGCGSPAMNFNQTIVGANKQIEQAGRRFGESLQPVMAGRSGDAARVRASYNDVKQEFQSVQTNMQALKVPDLPGAKELYDEHQLFLRGQAIMIEGEFAEIVRIVESGGPGQAARIQQILQSVGRKEQADLAKLQNAQRSFATKNNLKLQ